MVYEIKIVWDGPFSAKKVIDTLNDGGSPPDYDIGKGANLYS